jgi:integrase
MKLLMLSPLRMKRVAIPSSQSPLARGDMVKLRLKYLIEDVDRHGNVRIYFRRSGHRKIRLRGLPGSEEFQAGYAKALAATQGCPTDKTDSASKGSLEWLCRAYYQSADFRRLDQRTQHVRQLILQRLCASGAGPLPFRRMTATSILKWRDSQADRPEAANSLVKALRQLFAFAIEYRLTDNNPAKEIRYLRGNSEGHHSWTEEEVEQYERFYPVGSAPRLALALLLFTGQRRSDVVLFGRQNMRDGWLHFTQQKNRNRRPVTLHIPIHPELRRIIDASKPGSMTFLISELGRPFSANGFGNRFRKWCNEAGLPSECTSHGLRKAAAARLAEAGATELEIGAITGHQTSKEIARYTKAASQKRMAKAAMEKLTGNKIVSLSTRELVPTTNKTIKSDR